MKTQYFGVIGNRDYIKLRGEKRPFWEFLDKQPDGWLTSLVYSRDDLPQGRQMIFDCGAWSYRNEEIPPVSADSVASDYARMAPAGSMVIAPDHMLIPGVDVAARREWNAEQARRFLDICQPNLLPMACVHGMELEERLEHTAFLLGLGYKHLAIGGLAARAGQKAEVVSWVRAIRNAAPDVWLHVLGLSSPAYMRLWREIGIQSADGSSHFKQAFTAGAFFFQHGAKLQKYQAARPGEDVSAPECNCRACAALREDGVDTRRYGSNESNMGRAAHNLNALMRAQEEAMRRTIVLVACCGQKREGAHPAAELYQSDLFLKSREWAETHGSEWAILSAKHGLVMPGDVVESYDLTLNDMAAPDRVAWSQMVRRQLAGWEREKIVILAGKNYCGWTEGLNVERPMQGLGIGQQLAWLKQENEAGEVQMQLWK